MASLKELRDRISSVKATQKITKAMQMVAAAKFRLAQESAELARPYTNHIEEIFQIAVQEKENNFSDPKISGTGFGLKHLLVIFTADRGLCGGYNSQIARFAKSKITELFDAGKEVKLFFVGKKGADILKREFSDLTVEEISLRDVRKMSYSEAEMIASKLESLFSDHVFDVCDLIYAHFVSVLQQTPRQERLIPALSSFQDLDLNISEEESNARVGIKNIAYEFEPEVENLLPNLIQQRLRQKLFSALLENVAGEMGSKMTAMDNATRNAGDMIDKLSVTYNRRRQAQITTELIEIIAGAEAL